MKKVIFKRTKFLDIYEFFENDEKIKEVKFDRFNIGNKSHVIVSEKLAQAIDSLRWTREEGFELIEKEERKFFNA